MRQDIERWRGELEEALQYASGCWDFEDVASEFREGRMQLWEGVTSCIVTQLVDLPRKKQLFFFLAGGNLAEIEVMYPLIVEWGRSMGCTCAAMVGRRGWERTFLTRGAGWTPGATVFEREPL